MFLAKFFASVLLTSNSARANIKATFDGSVQTRFAEHIYSPQTPASERVELTGEQKLAFSKKWTVLAGGKFWYENVYYTQPVRYDGALRERDSREVRLQDASVTYRGDKWLASVGNQQVVWGESFGTAYADVVNPKDLREGTPMDSASSRLSVPMANVKFIGERFSLQGLVLPRPEFNILPLPSSDYSPFIPSQYGFQQVIVDREMRSAKTDLEEGGRLSGVIGPTDLSVFYFDHVDRNPVYELMPDTLPGRSLHLKEIHSRMQTVGFTFAGDINGYVPRFEAVNNMHRLFPAFANNQLVNYSESELNLTGSVDFPTWRSTNFSLQLASSTVSEDRAFILRKRAEQFFGARTITNLFAASTLEFLVFHSFADHGERLQGEFMTPLTSGLELHLGADLLGGPDESEMGRMHPASRVYVSLKSFWNGISKPRRRS